ncbi:hypothetical protein C1I92_02455 [Jiangella anatolica]|uniref:Uncharacterized protein n=1 Tax=Jiangella anatolica TaxID=2670374 RepID=A0A2W2BJ63_9ACTN|nr:hypothetical protein C1I92_02455 [Jiangella anatolica]
MMVTVSAVGRVLVMAGLVVVGVVSRVLLMSAVLAMSVPGGCLMVGVLVVTVSTVAFVRIRGELGVMNGVSCMLAVLMAGVGLRTHLFRVTTMRVMIVVAHGRVAHGFCWFIGSVVVVAAVVTVVQVSTLVAGIVRGGRRFADQQGLRITPRRVV